MNEVEQDRRYPKERVSAKSVTRFRDGHLQAFPEMEDGGIMSREFGQAIRYLSSP
jgi:hypothetical protein